jgi:hypothetical protein
VLLGLRELLLTLLGSFRVCGGVASFSGWRLPASSDTDCCGQHRTDQKLIIHTPFSDKALSHCENEHIDERLASIGH